MLPIPAGMLVGFGLVQLASLFSWWGERAARVVRAAGFVAFLGVLLMVPMVARLFGAIGSISITEWPILALAFVLGSGMLSAAERALRPHSTER